MICPRSNSNTTYLAIPSVSDFAQTHTATPDVLFQRFARLVWSEQVKENLRDIIVRKPVANRHVYREVVSKLVDKVDCYAH